MTEVARKDQPKAKQKQNYEGPKGWFGNADIEESKKQKVGEPINIEKLDNSILTWANYIDTLGLFEEIKENLTIKEDGYIQSLEGSIMTLRFYKKTYTYKNPNNPEEMIEKTHMNDDKYATKMRNRYMNRPFNISYSPRAFSDLYVMLDPTMMDLLEEAMDKKWLNNQDDDGKIIPFPQRKRK